MLSRNITIADEFGLHARPAAQIARNAERARSNVWIIAGSERADAKSMLISHYVGTNSLKKNRRQI